jgi:X-X-X-Leu-X-X-Gly heptad repeat protein
LPTCPNNQPWKHALSNSDTAAGRRRVNIRIPGDSIQFPGRGRGQRCAPVATRRLLAVIVCDPPLAFCCGPQPLAAGARSLAAGAQSFVAGAQSLAAGAQSLAAGSQSLVAGAQSLVAGVQSLVAGAQSLAAGRQSLAAGAQICRRAHCKCCRFYYLSQLDQNVIRRLVP